MDNEKKNADLKAARNSDSQAAQTPAQIADLKADLTQDSNKDSNPDLDIAETMAAGIPERETIDTIAAPTQSSSLVF